MVTASQIAAARARSDEFLTAKITISRSDPDEVTYVDGKIVTAPGTIIYTGRASISDASARDAVTTIIGGEAVQTATWAIRAPIDAQDVQPGDEVVVDDPGDFPLANRHLWVHGLKGRQTAVLARIIVTATRPGSVDGHG